MSKPRSEDRKQFLHDIFVTALEGGIGYWSECSDYHWSKPDGSEDLDGFYAVIHDVEEDGLEHRITIDTIARGVNLIAKARAPYYEPNHAHTQCAEVPFLCKSVADIVRAATFDNDASQIDSWVADEIVQVGLYGEVVYG